MKSCPSCNRTFADTFSFCLVDGAILSAPFDPEATEPKPTIRAGYPAPTEVISASQTADPVIPTIQSPPPPTYRAPYASTPLPNQRIPLIGKLTRRTFMKIVFALVSGYVLAAIVTIASQGGFGLGSLIYTYTLGAVYGWLIGTVIVFFSGANFFKKRSVLTGACVGAFVGLAVRFILLNVFTRAAYHPITGLIYVLGTSFPTARGGLWLGPMIFGAVLGAFLGYVYRLSARP